MKKQDLKELSVEELKVKLKDNQDAVMNLRFQKALQQLEHPKMITKVKREIAQLKTVLREFELGIRGKEL
tara:strand:- start:1228 stop:1437 length:210 start_codon:yes stop_codon:yes gene_type:complete